MAPWRIERQLIRNVISSCQPKNWSAISLTTLILLLSVGFVQFHRFLREFKLCSLSHNTSKFLLVYIPLRFTVIVPLQAAAAAN